MDRSSTVVLAAFEGWNDAADVASGSIDHLIDAWDPELVHTVDPDPYYDFQVNRPMVGSTDAGERTLTWGTTRVFHADRSRTGGRDLVLIRGIEPNMRWRSFCDELIEATGRFEPEMAITIGALLADNPHTRPVPVSVTSEDAGLQAAWDLPGADYEGPSGIVGVLGHMLQDVGVPSISLWAAIPHYMSAPPCPKGTIALLDKLDDLLDLRIDPGELSDLARAWQRSADELAGDDPELAEYVGRLEENSDASQIPNADAIAAEFERYLRRRGR